MYIYSYIVHVAQGIFSSIFPHQPNSGSAIASTYRSHGVSAIAASGKGEGRKPKQILRQLQYPLDSFQIIKPVIGNREATALPVPLNFYSSNQPDSFKSSFTKKKQIVMSLKEQLMRCSWIR